MKTAALDLATAQKIALDLMHRHGLIERGWRFAWGHGKRRLGSAEVRHVQPPRGGVRFASDEQKTLRLSRHLVRLNGEAVVRDVILHEIAHALVGVGQGHNARWKAECVRIGAKPQRLAGREVHTQAGRYEVWCDGCRQLIGHRHRKAKRSVVLASYCRACGPGASGKLRIVDTQATRSIRPARGGGLHPEGVVRVR